LKGNTHSGRHLSVVTFWKRAHVWDVVSHITSFSLHPKLSMALTPVAMTVPALDVQLAEEATHDRCFPVLY